MPNSKQIVYLSQSQYADLIANGSITVDGVTVTYNEDDIYVTPQAEPVTNVRINGTSISSNGIANIPLASQSSLGVVKQAGTGYSVSIQNDGTLKVVGADTATIKGGSSNSSRPILPSTIHVATFYGLTRAAGVNMASSDNTIGTYTPEAKGAIQQMLGVSDLIATAENTLVASKAYKVGDVFTANGKLYKVTSAIAADEAIVLQNDGETVSGANAVETKVGEGFVKFTDYARENEPGIVGINSDYGIAINNQQPGHYLYLNPATPQQIKTGTQPYRAITPDRQEKATFYGLAKAAGDITQSASDNAVGQYTDNAKAAIRAMIGAENGDDIVKVQDEEPTTAATKIWLPETAPESVTVPTVAEMEQALSGKVEDVQINGTSVVTDGVANIPVAMNNGDYGVIKTVSSNGIGVAANGALYNVKATDAQVKAGTNEARVISPANQHVATFYGLAKAAGDTTQAASDNAVGTYTDDAKSAIRTMLGAVGDVQVNGTSIITNNVANIPIATQTTFGVTKGYGSSGINIDASGNVSLAVADTAKVKAGTSNGSAIPPSMQHTAAFYGLAKAAGDTTQSASSNAVGTYTDNAKASIKSMLGIQDGSTGTVDVSGTTPTITAVENTRYVCGEVTSLNFTPAASGICIVRFTSGSTVTVLTLPSTVKFPEWFDPTSLETNTIYEICVTDGIYGAVMSWAQ